MSANNYSSEDDFDDLDDVLDDFDEEILSQAPGATLGSSAATPTISPAKPTDKGQNVHLDSAIGDGQGSKESQEEPEIDEQEIFSSLLKEISGRDPELSKNLSSFLDDLSNGESSNAPIPTTATNNRPEATTGNTRSRAGSTTNSNFQSVISETMSRLKTSGEQIDKSLEEEDKDDQLLTTLLKSLDLNLDLGEGGEAGEGGEDISKLLVDMLDKLSSKNVLFEPLNDLYLKYPAWLSDPKNKKETDAKQFENYETQFGIITQIIGRFNKSDFDEHGKDKEFVNEKLEELQELGMPPKDLVNEDLNFLNMGGGSGRNPAAELGLSDDDIPEDIGKELEDNCKQT